jgi:hypothetical protein
LRCIFHRLFFGFRCIEIDLLLGLFLLFEFGKVGLRIKSARHD